MGDRDVQGIQRHRFCFFCFGIFCDSACRTAHSMEVCKQHRWLSYAYENNIYGKQAKTYPTTKAANLDGGKNEMEEALGLL